MTGAGTTGAGLDWPGLIRAGLQDLRLHPDQFWSLTPAELGLMLGLSGALAPRMTRDRLASLAARYPDAPGQAGAVKAEAMGDHDDGIQ